MAMVRITLSMLFRVSKSFGLVLRKTEYILRIEMTQRYFTMFFKSKFKNNSEDLVEGPDHLKSLKVYFNARLLQVFHPKCATH